MSALNGTLSTGAFGWLKVTGLDDEEFKKVAYIMTPTLCGSKLYMSFEKTGETQDTVPYKNVEVLSFPIIDYMRGYDQQSGKNVFNVWV